ncbi:hydroxyacid dehydrogenase [Pseudonocardia sp. CNS-139]|nr:hydroxyacid dehydrogenase [Pseudonocardia sp. CNS-139]
MPLFPTIGARKSMPVSPLRVVAAHPAAPELADLVKRVDPGIEVVVDLDLVRPMRFSGEDPADPRFARTAGEQAAYERLVSSADVLLGIPDGDPVMLARILRAGAPLRWLHTLAAGGGGQIRQAGLSADELARVVFTTSAGVHAGPLAEFALFGLLVGAKDLRRLQELQSRHTWGAHFTMRHLRDQTVVVLGLGAIGTETARLLSAVGMRVLGVKRTPGPVPHVESVHGVDELPDLLPQADGVVVTLPGTPFTDGLLSRDLLMATKPGAVLVNVGRGTVVDEDALVEVLRSGHLRAAVLDVTAVEPLPPGSPLWTMPQVVISPHTAAADPAAALRSAELFAENLRRFVAGEPLRNVVDTVHFY